MCHAPEVAGTRDLLYLSVSSSWASLVGFGFHDLRFDLWAPGFLLVRCFVRRGHRCIDLLVRVWGLVIRCMSQLGARPLLTECAPVALVLERMRVVVGEKKRMHT